MRIACPACNAAYAVPDVQLSEARVVRCARCGTDWAPLDMLRPSEEELPPPEPVLEASAPVAEPSSEAARMAIEDEVPVPIPPAAVLPKPTVEAPTPMLLVMAWVVSVGAVIAGLAGLYAGRERVMAVWPPSVRAYAALGLAAHAPPIQHESEGRE